MVQSSFQQLLATPQCFLECYPHEGGSYSIPASNFPVGGGQGQILSLTVRKFMKEAAGSFVITLAPGGPNGANAPPSWIDIITPMSFVMIGMARGQYSNLVMCGVVTSAAESWSFPSSPGERVMRTITIMGYDFGYFFTHFSWYALTFLNVNGAGLSAALGGGNAGALGTIQNYGGGLTQGSPDAIGAAWFQNVMDGGNGILSRTWVQDGSNNPLPFSQAVQVQFEKYITSADTPFSFTYVNAEENWYDKFNKIFPYPFYEFFIMTAPSNFYGTALSTRWNQVNTGSAFAMKKLGYQNPAQINIIARVNPLPYIVPNITGGGSTGANPGPNDGPGGNSGAGDGSAGGTGYTLGNINVTAWNNLTLFQEDTSLIRTTEEFSEEEVRNFYLINPTYQTTMLGQSNNASTPPTLALQAAVDPASVHRYGFRPAYIETEWLSDPSGQIAQTGQLNIEELLATMTCQLSSQYEPTPLMMRAVRQGALRPDIIPGNKFQYQPLKGPDLGPWLFYIEGVEHEYVFGGKSTTKLTLSRGLPANVYANTSLLTQIHLGNAQRLNSQYQQGLPQGPNQTPEKPLEVVNLLDPNIQQVLADIAPIYSTPGQR